MTIALIPAVPTSAAPVVTVRSQLPLVFGSKVTRTAGSVSIAAVTPATGTLTPATATSA